jgi:hypothetical protein
MNRFAGTWMFLASACAAHGFPIAREQLPELATFHETGHAHVSDGTRTFDLAPQDEPQLRLELTQCVAWSRRDLICHDHIVTHLDDLSLQGERLRLREVGSHSMVQDIPIDHVRAASLDFKDWRAASWRPTLGFGLAFGGPSGLGAGLVQVLPADWLALELGAGYPDGSSLDVYTGFRVRPETHTNPRPFAGGFAGAIYGSSHASAIGPRAGIDFEFSQRTMLFTLEVDYARAISAPYDATALVTRHWFVWGGVTFTYFL